MSAMQPSISYTCSFTDNGNLWKLTYSRGLINIQTEGGVNLTLNYLADEIAKYSEDSESRMDGLNTWGELETRGFTLTASTRTYMNEENSELDDYKNKGCIDVYFNATEYTGCHTVIFPVPYLLAKGLMSLARGETHLEGATMSMY